MEEYINDAFTRNEGKTNLDINNITAACITSKNNKFQLDSEGNLIVKSINTRDRLLSSITILDAIYPIGTVYMSINSTNPSVLFGGEWEQIKDRFLLSCGDKFESNTAGGNIEHNHGYRIGYRPYYGGLAGNDTSAIQIYDYKTRSWVYAQKDTGIPADNITNAGMQASSSSNKTPTRSSVRGYTESASNMPPYLTVYMWKRTQ